MLDEFDFELFQELTAATGPVGYEDAVRDIVERELRESTDEVRRDAMGNVVGTINGESDYRVTVAAHTDEWGWIVERVTDDGFLKLKILGGTNPSTARSQRVTVKTQTEELMGIIGAVPPHMLEEEDLDMTPDKRRQDVWDVEDVYVDLGRSVQEVRDRVSPGDVVTLKQETVKMGDYVTGKAFDNRALVFAMLEAARRIEDPAVTIDFAATVQEEVGLRGAEALASDLDPDLAIALDITLATDQPEYDEDDHISETGAGTAIKVMDRRTLTNPKVYRRMQRVAEAASIPYQLELHSSGGTDAGAFQNGQGATPVGAILLPTRNIHSDTASAHIDDVSATIDLLTEFLATEEGDEYIL
ncbi:M42 family metallopeptidase [Natronosalvus halobius]|uniref:M42 family metallopeptidase n=1 Tax=Natronosalvus halobius TaxID=2953746 RepID=UPI00209D0304|nr:M20/M25/M40 family metallo-hydrolase [Natronosalvus halobius]USZ73657.1 M20/M25/M40 family metallo-hydrolase [Natronosalvus halobius]